MRTTASPFARVFILVALLTTFFSTACTHTANIQTDPPGATVTKDGRFVGKTPIAAPVDIGPMSGEQTFTVEKDGASRTVSVANDQFMMVPFLVSILGGFMGAASMVLFATSIGGVQSPIGLTLLALSPVPIVTTPLVNFFFYAWRVPETINISLKNKDVFTSPLAQTTVISASGNLGRRKLKRRKKMRVVREAKDDKETVRRKSPQADEESPRLLTREPVRRTTASVGAASGACYGNGTCDAGLSCVDDVCREEAADGTAGGACYGNGTCNAGLSCTDGVCREAADGTEGGRCYGNNTCNAGLSCVDALCVAE